MIDSLISKCVNLVILCNSYVTHTDSTLLTFEIN